MKLGGSFNNSFFQKSIDFIVKNTVANENITFVFTEECTIFYTEGLYGQLQVLNNLEIKSGQTHQSNPCVGILIKQSILQKLASKMKPFDTFEFLLVKGPKLKFYSHQYSFVCQVELVHQNQFRAEVNVPAALKFKLPDLKKYANVLSSLGETVTISLGDYMMLEQNEPGSKLCIKIRVEILELYENNGNPLRITVHTKALAKLFKSNLDHSVGCITQDFFGVYVQLPNDGWMILSLDTLIEG